MTDWVFRLLDEAGYVGVAILMFLETVFPPIPSEVIMSLAGVRASFPIGENLELYGRIDNLFDRQYENPDGFEQTGIGAYVGVRFNN